MPCIGSEHNQEEVEAKKGGKRGTPREKHKKKVLEALRLMPKKKKKKKMRQKRVCAVTRRKREGEKTKDVGTADERQKFS